MAASAAPASGRLGGPQAVPFRLVRILRRPPATTLRGVVTSASVVKARVTEYVKSDHAVDSPLGESFRGRPQAVGFSAPTGRTADPLELRPRLIVGRIEAHCLGQ